MTAQEARTKVLDQFTGSAALPGNEAAFETALDQYTDALLTEFEDYMDEQPDTRPYQEDEFKLAWAQRRLDEFRTKIHA